MIEFLRSTKISNHEYLRVGLESWQNFSETFLTFITRGPAESWRDLFDYFNIDYFKIFLKFQVSQVDSALPTQKK